MFLTTLEGNKKPVEWSELRQLKKRYSLGL